ncbi:MAG: hypothetical protein ONB46_20085 [candidate division KSB1 bacterium]|nr:hypothetical protein [candidate division KSB1 bacterium]MDZ7368760.1 hypothetical protein [candidate division KSB1 bacterium]MDZ7406423.1 hypothetical protein [candidate division KSB1 bacterium]
MFRRLIAAAFIVGVYFITGCAGSSRTIINQESVPYFTNAKIMSVTLLNGEVIVFDANGGQYHERYNNKPRVIVGKTAQGESTVIALDNVRTARLDNGAEEVDNRGLFFPTILIVGVAVAIL